MTSQAIIEAAERFASGDVEGQSKTFAPAAPEFITEVRKRQDYLDLKARPRIARPEYRPGLMAPFETARMKALNANAHLPVLHEDISYDQFRKLSAGKELPVGSKWVAATGTVYGPEPTANRKVA